MGQYYRPILGDANGFNCKVFNRKVDGDYTQAKLMEHSWWTFSFVNSFSAKLYKHRKRVCWVGDYADKGEIAAGCSPTIYVPCYHEIWGETVKLHGSRSTNFTLNNKFLLNHDTKEYIDLNEYKFASANEHGWVIHPLPLLTAVGNGRGFGDFKEGSIGYENVGIWAWHLLSISDKPPKSYSKLQLTFKEC